jgi:ribosome maturation factor RimP
MLDLIEIRERVEAEIITDPVFMVDAEISGSGGSRIVRFVVDTDSGIKIDQLVKINRAIGNMLETEDLIPFKYRLEVVSPGLQRPVKHPRLLKKALGKELKVRYRITDDDSDSEKEFNGKLERFDEESFHFIVKGEMLEVEAANLIDMYYILEW